MKGNLQMLKSVELIHVQQQQAHQPGHQPHHKPQPDYQVRIRVSENVDLINVHDYMVKCG